MTPVVNTPAAGPIRRSRGSKLLRAMRKAPGPTLCAFVIIALLIYAFVVPLFSLNPFEFSGMSVLDSFIPPAWMADGSPDFPLGTDDQGRNLITAMAYGMRTSIIVGFLSVTIGLVLGGSLGLIAGFVGGKVDAFIMRVADVQLAYPALLLAMIIDGAARAALGTERSVGTAIAIVVMSIGIAFWVQYARTIRSSVMIERDQDYVSAARITGRSNLAIIVLHILPNVMAPVLVIATINLGIAIITEATLSFLGIGIPVTSPSLGTLIRNGNNFLQSGEWWISVWPCLVLVLFVVSVNILGDHLRDVYNPRLRGRS
ncbi:ABC transporter permease [Neorhizobium galegae]|uniref:ABC transporter permease n=1 Tax=Neorhizobium galegae TaxID=399 RepID=UPI000622536B|nr:ABC transporter permease [Neorhizobium galegae]CDZ29666.1 Dipeptide transport system permease protein (ABC superfamily, membrane) [Neorhizobium galegae bv. officinalis]KAA9385171.1 ABC transporter permease [Neorhizobium galegae]KAB1110491.1 ABC transporter permease [Neorhizobium galegae]MCM2499807.1 ABC transporter permease [Neorhizobium galegae]MCQ1773532.1 ABC transporter permease [Neorhizobium galegae]